MQDKKAVLTPDATYHLYNRANGNEKLFLSRENYRFFLEKYKTYTAAVAETFCYCLMPNHFHFLLRIKSQDALLKTFKDAVNLSESPERLLSKQFSNFFNSYSKAFNKQQSRKGNLFMHTFKRKRITDEKYLRKAVHYIHHNPIEAGLANSPEKWEHSSYNAIINPEGFKSFILREEVVEWFGDKENFIYCHTSPPKETGIEDFF